jgi:hypothetical protein
VKQSAVGVAVASLLVCSAAGTSAHPTELFCAEIEQVGNDVGSTRSDQRDLCGLTIDALCSCKAPEAGVVANAAALMMNSGQEQAYFRPSRLGNVGPGPNQVATSSSGDVVGISDYISMLFSCPSDIVSDTPLSDTMSLLSMGRTRSIMLSESSDLVRPETQC